MSPKTLVKNVAECKQKTVWVAGLKIDKYAGDETQYIHTSYVTPQEVEVELADQSRWGSIYSTDRILLKNINLSNGKTVETLKRWESNQYGVKFFKDAEHAKKYFLVVTKNLYDATHAANEEYSLIYSEIEKYAPSFLKDLEY